MCSCATSSTGCNTSTTRNATTLPGDEEDRARPGKDGRLRFPGRLFPPACNRLRDAVSRHFESVFAERDPEAAPWPEHPRPRRAALQPALRGASRRLQTPARRAGAGAREGSRGHRRSAATLARGVDLVEAIASRAAYLALLAENPEALERVTRIIAPRAGRPSSLTRHPLLLDEAARRSPALRAAGPGRLRARAAFPARRAPGRHRAPHEPAARDAPGAGVPDARAGSGRLLSVERLADHLSALADLVLAISLEQVWSELRGRHLEGAPRFAVISYGQLGGKELGYASDSTSSSCTTMRTSRRPRPTRGSRSASTTGLPPNPRPACCSTPT